MSCYFWHPVKVKLLVEAEGSQETVQQVKHHLQVEVSGRTIFKV